MDILPFPHHLDVWRVRLRVHRDERNSFVERWNDDHAAGLGLPPFVQDNHSRSQRWVLRGLHFQAPPYAQGKLVSVSRAASPGTIPTWASRWPLEPGRTPRLSAKDAASPRLADRSSPFSVAVSENG